MATTAGHHEHGEAESHGTEHGAAHQSHDDHLTGDLAVGLSYP
jgi:hypothetical protein